MFAVSKEVEIAGIKIICTDLTYGYIVGIENGTRVDSKHDVIIDATNLTKDDIFELKRSEVETLYETIVKLTYPELYDKDGKRIDQDKPENDKKKA